MTSAAKKYFDVLSYVKTSKALGVKEDLAEYQARQLAEIIDIASANTQEEFTVRELATKTDIHELREATKTDIQAVKTDIHELRAATQADIHELRSELKADIYELGTTLRTEFKADIYELRTELKTDIRELRTDVNGLKDTTKDLVDRIGNLRYDTIKFVVWTGVSIVVFIGTMMAKGFHWL